MHYALLGLEDEPVSESVPEPASSEPEDASPGTGGAIWAPSLSLPHAAGSTLTRVRAMAIAGAAGATL